MVDYYNDFIFDFLEQNGLNKEIRKNPAVYDFIGSIFSYEIKKNYDSFNLNKKQLLLYELSTLVFSENTMNEAELNSKIKRIEFEGTRDYFVIDKNGNLICKYAPEKDFDIFEGYLLQRDKKEMICAVDSGKENIDENTQIVVSTFTENFILEPQLGHYERSTFHIQLPKEYSVESNLTFRQYNKFGLEMALKNFFQVVTMKQNDILDKSDDLIEYLRNIKSDQNSFATENDVIRGKDLITNKFYVAEFDSSNMKPIGELMKKYCDMDLTKNENLILQAENPNIFLIRKENCEYPDICPKSSYELNKDEVPSESRIIDNLLMHNSEKMRVFKKMLPAQKKEYKKNIINQSMKNSEAFQQTYLELKQGKTKKFLISLKECLAKKIGLSKIKNEIPEQERFETDERNDFMCRLRRLQEDEPMIIKSTVDEEHMNYFKQMAESEDRRKIRENKKRT